jgi:nucleoside 2-deoxyribosyltransferase
MSDEGVWWDDKKIPSSIDGSLFQRRDGRQYILTGTLLKLRPNLVNECRAGITRYIDEHPNEQPVFIFPETVDDVLRRPPMPFSQRARLLAREIAQRLGNRPGRIDLELSPHIPLFCDFMRSCYVDSTEELIELLKYWEEQSVIELQFTHNGKAHIRLPVRGLVALEQDDEALDSQTAFVAMWFSPEMTAAYDKAIAPAVEAQGYIPVRIDRREHNNKIDDEIISEIRRAKFLIADFSCGPDGARGGVYYEAGFAAGLGKAVIYMVRQPDLERVHFDTRQFNHVVWDNEADLHEKLRNRIGASLGAYRRS